MPQTWDRVSSCPARELGKGRDRRDSADGLSAAGLEGVKPKTLGLV